MDNLDVMTLADDLTISAEAIIKHQQFLDSKRIYAVLDYMQVLNRPISEYFELIQEQYYEEEADHKLTLQNLDQPIKATTDRIMTNHVDGFVNQGEINFTYNHEDPFAEGKYDRKVDFHVLSYGLKVIGAVVPVMGVEALKQHVSKDAILSLGLSTYALEHQA